MNAINLTPHNVSVSMEGNVMTFPSSGIARVSTVDTQVGSVDLDGVAIPVVSTSYGDVEGLPAPVPGTIYIVSGVVLNALKGTRPDVYAPDSGDSAIRNEKGHVVAVTRLRQ